MQLRHCPGQERQRQQACAPQLRRTTTVPVEGAAAGALGLTPTQLGGKEDAAAERGAAIESCMFTNVALSAQMQDRSCGLCQAELFVRH